MISTIRGSPVATRRTSERLCMFRKLIFAITICYTLSLLVLTSLVVRASPAPRSQTIRGVGIGSYGSETGIAYISGRRLTCTSLPPTASFTTQCTIEVAGKPLTLLARRNTPPNLNQLGGTCEAVYDGTSWPCRMGSRHVHTHWFAFVESPLGLDRAQLDTVRARYPIENLPEQPFLVGIVLVAGISSLLALLCAIAWFWPRRSNKVVVFGTAVAVACMVFVGSGIWALFATSGFWD